MLLLTQLKIHRVMVGSSLGFVREPMHHNNKNNAMTGGNKTTPLPFKDKPQESYYSVNCEV